MAIKLPVVKTLAFKDLQAAWEGINEYLAREEEEIWANGGGIYGPEIVSYNNFVRVKRMRVDPEFDFGKVLGYSIKKWSSLVSNYVDLNYLELIASEIQLREKKKAKSYNYTFHFNNAHGSGKDCLISLTFTKRLGQENPVLVFHVRTSEVTKRLIFDFLLCQRIAEYVYGVDNTCEFQLIAPSYYITAESFAMYNNHRSIRKVLGKKNLKNPGRFQKRILKTYEEFMQPEARNQKYKVFLRSIMQIQKDEDGEPLSGVKSLKAKDLKIYKESEFPEDIISPRQKSTHRRKTNKAARENGQTIKRRKRKKN